MTDSHRLVVEYVQRGSEDAFRDLVTRYLGLVYSAALRLVGGDAHLAKDVSQMVFMDLAREARALPDEVMLGGWLHRHTCFVAAKTMRGERRRHHREKQAVEMNALEDQAGSEFCGIAPLLDEAINELAEPDRRAILLRFFEQREFRSIGETLGSSEDAARVRVNRALEKLQSLLKRRGITSTATALSLVLSAHAVQSAPAGLALSIAAAALAGTGAAATAAVTVTKTLTMTTIQKTLIAAAVAAALGTGFYQTQQRARLRDQLRLLQQQQEPVADRIRQLARERDDATNRLAALTAELATAKRDNAELLRLRAEVSQLHSAAKVSHSLRATASADPADATAKSWLQRVAFVKQSLDRWPGKKTPELQLLSEQDWLDATAQRSLDTDKDLREAMSDLRIEAKKKLAGAVKEALDRYTAANNQQLPPALSDLLPFFQPALDPAMLAGYEIAPPGAVHPPSPGPADGAKAEVWALLEKGEPADKEYDHCIVIFNGAGGYWTYGPVKMVKN